MMPEARQALYRTLTWFETLGYAPTRAELMMTIDDRRQTEDERRQIAVELEQMCTDGSVVERSGRFGFPESASRIIQTIRERDVFQPRKRRRARRVARFLAMLPSVRFVALANTTALGIARDSGDLDFFVVARAGTIWTTRLFGGFPFRLLGLTPSVDEKNVRDAVCLSYFVTDDALDLSSHQLSVDDPYFRYWFLSLLPLFDDGISQELWRANVKLCERHPYARMWSVIGGRGSRCCKGCTYVRGAMRVFEPLTRSLQMKWFPDTIRRQMNRDTTVIVTDHALKLHVTDGRAAFREKYYEACRKRGIHP